jgi:hypothetical protein
LKLTLKYTLAPYPMKSTTHCLMICSW